jgi:hypothetical protein
MIDIFKEITLKEYTRAGIGAIAMLFVVWYFYNQTEKQQTIIMQHQVMLNKRVERLESDIMECNATKFEALRNQVDKSNMLIERTDKHLTEIELLIKNK